VTPLIKQDIVHHVIERTGLPRTKAEAAVDTVFEGLKQALTAGERIELRGFGVFSVRARKTGQGTAFHRSRRRSPRMKRRLGQPPFRRALLHRRHVSLGSPDQEQSRTAALYKFV